MKTFEGMIETENLSYIDTWKLFIESDVFVMARSSFSYVPAILNLWNPAVVLLCNLQGHQTCTLVV